MTVEPAAVQAGEGVADGLLSGRYRLGDLLGAGEAGHTYRGHDVLLRRAVAVKVLDGLAGDVGVARAVRAARAAARASHPRLIGVLDVEGGRPPFVVLEPASGVPLRTLLTAGQPTRRLALVIADDVLDALAAVHDAGAVHRGVGLDNVWLAGDGRPLLTAAGLGPAARDPGLGLGISAGEDRIADRRSDVLDAAVLVRTLLGEHVDGRLAEVLERAAAPRPEDRHADAAELRDDLRRAAAAASPTWVQPAALPGPAPQPAAEPAPQPAVERAPRPAAGGGRVARPGRLSRILARLFLGAGAAAAAWLMIGVPLMASLDAEEPAPAVPAVAPAAPAAPDRTVLAAPTPLAPPAELPADALRRIVDTAAASPADLGPQTADLLARLQGLDRLRGVARAAEAAALYGLAAVDAASGANSAELSRQVAELLRPELSVDGLVGLIDRDPAAVGADAQVFGTRLRVLDSLPVEEQGPEAHELWLQAQDARSRGTITPQFDEVARTVLSDLRQAR